MTASSPSASSKAAASALLVLMAALVWAPFGEALSVAPATWHVTTDTTIEGVPWTLATDVVIESGGALHLRGVDAIVLSTPLHAVEITVRAGGVLDLADGHDAVTGATVPTRLATPQGAFFVSVEAGGTLRSDGAAIANGVMTLGGDATIVDSTLVLTAGGLRVIGGTTEIRGSTLHGSPDDLVKATGGSVRVLDTSLVSAGSSALFATSGADALLDGVSIGQTGAYGLRIEGASGTIERSTFQVSPEYALFGAAATIHARNSTWLTHCGMYVMQGSTLDVTGNDVRTIDHGIMIYDSTATITNNSLVGMQQALLYSNAGGKVADDLVQHARRGLTLVQGSSIEVARNDFDGNDGAIEVALGGAASAPTIRGNAIHASLSFGVSNALTTTVDANGNWWGAAGGANTAGADVTTGLVDASGWLTSWP